MDREFWRKKAVERGTEILNLKNKLDIAIETLEEYADRKMFVELLRIMSSLFGEQTDE